MSIAEAKARIHELLVAGFGERGYSFSKLPSKDPNYRRWSVFSKAVAMAPPAPTAQWVVIVDVLGARKGKGEYVTLYMECCLRIDAVAEMLTDRAPPLGPGTYSFSPGSVARGEEIVWEVQGDEDPGPAIDGLLGVVDRVALPRFERYSVVENFVRMAAPREVGTSDLVEREVDDDEGREFPWSFMSVIAGAYLLGRLELCERIVARVRAHYARAEKGSVEGSLGEDFEQRLRAFYEGQRLEERGVSRERWLGG